MRRENRIVPEEDKVYKQRLLPQAQEGLEGQELSHRREQISVPLDY
jgi:hypothetical protein